MNILVIHEIDWLKKVTYEIHHLSEIFSLSGNAVYVVDIPDPGKLSLSNTIYKTVFDYHRVYSEASVTLFRTPIIPIKGLNRISAHFTSYKFIKKILMKYDIDVVLLYSVVTNAKATLKACKEMKIPVVHRTFDIIHELIRENYLRKKVLGIEKFVYPKFDKVLANTPHMKIWAEEMGAKNVSVLPQGIDPNIMKPLPVDVTLKQTLGLKENDKVVMYLGSIEAFSGLEVLIEKIPIILKGIPELKLLVIGGGSHLKNLKQQVKKLGIEDKVIFTGFRPYLEIPNYCSLAKLCVNTFRVTEMTDKLSPVKIFDLLSCGKPVLATPLLGLLHDFPKESDILIYSDLEDFDKKIISLINNDNLENIGKRGRDYVEKNFTWNKVAQSMLNEFSKFLN